MRLLRQPLDGQHVQQVLQGDVPDGGRRPQGGRCPRCPRCPRRPRRPRRRRPAAAPVTAPAPAAPAEPVEISEPAAAEPTSAAASTATTAAVAAASSSSPSEAAAEAASPAVRSVRPAEEAPQEEEPPKKVQANTSRCWTCNRKIGLLGFQCKCEYYFCAEHRYSDRHECAFDFKAQGKQLLTKANPTIAPAKMDAI